MKTMPFPRRAAPELAQIEQKLFADRVIDPRNEVRERLLAAGLKERVRPGAHIAITAGSRGIGGFLELLAGIADACRAVGAEPFLIPAMGSHGGATAAGQIEILHRLGVDEHLVSAPIRATMDTLELGRADSGAVAHLDRYAAYSDGIIVLGRVKTHPESAVGLASGLLKMCTIGLGKQIGAQQAHGHGLWNSVRAVPKLQLQHGKILYGVAVVENGYRQPAVIEIVPPSYEAFLEADMRLLNIARAHLPRIPFSGLDLLIVDELGKNISGAGMDPNVIGHGRLGSSKGGPDYRRIVVLSLTPPSLGNGLGIGLADFTTRRFADAYDSAVTYVNLLTASEPGGTTREGPLPLALPSDREAIEVALGSSLAEEAPRVCRIRSTAELDRFWVSPSLLAELKQDPKLTVIQAPMPMRFDVQGNLF